MLKKTVERGRTLLADGPASVILNTGKAEIFGLKLRTGEKVIIREGKRLPFFVKENSCFEISLGVGARANEVEGDSIPLSWSVAYTNVKDLPKRTGIVMVVGGADSGKSGFCTYLANRLMTDGCRVAILDEDLGQSDIGPPSTVAYATLTKPVTDLFDLVPESVFFVGATSPVSVQDKTVEAVCTLRNEVLRRNNIDYLIVNTDGWIMGDEARLFKSRLASELIPGIVFCLETPSEIPSSCPSLGDALAGFRQERVDSPVLVRERDVESRRSLRELGFAKYLEKARIKVVQLSHIKIEERKAQMLVAQGGAEDLLVALYDAQKHFLGIGVVRAVDYRRRAIKIFTAVDQNPAFITFGSVHLDENLREF